MKTVIDKINEAVNATPAHKEAAAIEIVQNQLASEIRLLAHKGELNDFEAHLAVVRLVTQYASGPTSDLYQLADRVYQLNWLGRLLRNIEEAYVLSYAPRYQR